MNISDRFSEAMKTFSNTAPFTEVNGELSELTVKYKFVGDGTSFGVECGENRPKVKMKRQMHDCKVYTVDSDEYFNRGVKRGNTILITGDRPRFALARPMAQDRLDPEIIKLGDCRIRLAICGVEVWLDLADEIHTTFNPGSTEYEIRFSQIPNITLQYTVSQAEDWGAVACLSISGKTDDPADIDIELAYGGISSIQRTLTAGYFSPDTADVTGNSIKMEGNIAVLCAELVPFKVYITDLSNETPEITDSRVSFRHMVHLKPGGTEKVYLAVCISDDSESKAGRFTDLQPEFLIKESSYYYKNLFSDIKISTPDKILDAGFLTAVINHDYDYTEPAWLEGIHWWAAPWCNNYQISAAVSLGQTDRARKALEFFASPEEGPCATIMSNGKPYKNIRFNHDDGLPYYLHELIQYYEHSGDKELLNAIWAKIITSVARLLKNRDMKGNGLLSWHMGCNAFMYQADHLSMPGDAASPSLMMAGLIERLSDIAYRIGKTEDAAKWIKISEKMYSKVVELLWNNEAGVFFNHIDFQEIKHMAHYYTDLVFPALYTSLPEEYSWQSLDYLSRTLWVNNLYGEKTLMRVGNFKPSIFGNDNIMPAQMAEAARAYFKTGDSERGYKLLESVALAGTVFTEAPGNFPERMSDEGKGEANYIFGNPIGSFIYTVVDGLFGLSVVEGGSTIKWEPSFPEMWDHAEFQLPYVKVAYKRLKNNIITTKVFQLENSSQKTLVFSIFLGPCEIKNILHNGKSIEYKVSPGQGKIKLEMYTENLKSNEIRIEYAPLNIILKGSDLCYANSPVSRECNQALEEISDPQNALACIKLEENKLNGVTSKIGKDVRCETLDLSNYFNSSTIWATSRWRMGVDTSFDMKVITDEIGSLNTKAGTFSLPIKGPYMVLLEWGRSDSYNGKITRSDKPNDITIPIGEKASILSLLYVTEVESRHTGCEVGFIELLYQNGTISDIPLVVGKNIDSLFSHFAEDTISIQLYRDEWQDDKANILRIRCNPLEELKEIKIQINAADVQFGLMGATLVL